MRKIIETNRYSKDLKRTIKRNLDIEKLIKVLEFLADRQDLPEKNRDHVLSGNFKGCRECHIEPDWLLIYEVSEDDNEIILRRTGTHSDLF